MGPSRTTASADFRVAANWVRQPSLTSLLLTLLLVLPAVADAVPFHKTFIVDGVAPMATMQAAGTAETWQQLPPVKDDKLTLLSKPLVEFTDTHCFENTDTETFGGGKVAGDVDTQQPGADAGLAFHGQAEATDGENHAKATVDIFIRDTTLGPKVVDVRNPFLPNKKAVINNEVKVVLDGVAEAKAPKKPNKCNSAIAAAAADITGTNRFRVVAGGDVRDQIPLVTRLGKNDFLTGGANIVFGTQGNHDPYFMSVTDLDTGITTTEVIMHQDIEAFDAFFSVDDTGIRFVIDRTDPFSFVSLDFGVGLWVINPYSYSARLDNSGFMASGETPLAGWSLTTTADTVEAFFAFGPNGQPFDAVTVRPPDSLFTVGHEYRYDATVSNLAQEILLAREPPTWLMFGTGASLLLAYARRRGHPDRMNRT